LPEVKSDVDVWPELGELVTGLFGQFLGMNHEQRPPPEATGIRNRGHRLTRPLRVSQQRDGIPFLAQTPQGGKRLMLMVAQLENLSELFGQEVVEIDQSRNALEEQRQLLFDSFRLLADLAVGPAKDPPALMDKAVLLEKVVLVFLYQLDVR